MKTYYVTIEGLVSRVSKVDTDGLADAIKQAKKEFMSQPGALNAVFVSINEGTSK